MLTRADARLFMYGCDFFYKEMCHNAYLLFLGTDYTDFTDI